MSEKRREYYEEITSVRGVAIIIIFLLHSYIFTYLDMGIIPAEFGIWAFTGSSIFFFISGLVLTIRYKDGLNIKSFYKKRFRYLLPAYFIGSILVMIFRTGIFNLQSFINILMGINVWELWFLYVLIFYYLLFPILLEISKRINRKLIFGIIFTFIFLVFILQYNFDFFFLQKVSIVVGKNLIINFTVLMHVIPHLIYFLMGILIGFNYEKFKEKIIQFKIPIVIIWFIIFSSIPFCFYFLDFLVVGHFNIFTLFWSISTILFFFFIFTQRKSKFFQFNGQISGAFFLISPFIIQLISHFVRPIFIFFWSSEVWLLIISICFALITYPTIISLIATIRKMPYYQFLLTEIGDLNENYRLAKIGHFISSKYKYLYYNEVLQMENHYKLIRIDKSFLLRQL